MTKQFQCIVHGSFSKHLNEIIDAVETFRNAGIRVLAPKSGEIIDSLGGFVFLEGEKDLDPRFIELMYLHNLKYLGENGFSYFVNPAGYIGKSASYELGIAQLTNIRCFFSDKLNDHPAYIHGNSIWSPASLVDYIKSYNILPKPFVKPNEKKIQKLWNELMVPGSVVTTGAIIEYQPRKTQQEKEILLVMTHKWGGRYSIVGGKVRRNEMLQEALLREVKEETKLVGEPGTHLCTFDEIKDSGYYQSGIQHIFVDNVVKVKNKKVVLNEEAQDYIWALPSEALKHLDIEPNARKTIEIYSKLA